MSTLSTAAEQKRKQIDAERDARIKERKNLEPASTKALENLIAAAEAFVAAADECSAVSQAGQALKCGHTANYLGMPEAQENAIATLRREINRVILHAELRHHLPVEGRL